MMRQYKAHPCYRGMGLFYGARRATHLSTKYITTCCARQAAKLIGARQRNSSFTIERKGTT